MERVYKPLRIYFLSENMVYLKLDKDYKNFLYFTLAFLLTFIFLRVSIAIYDPYITIGSFELHHFDYGLILLFITILLLLFTNIRKTYLSVFSGISLALIVDEYWFVRSVYISPGPNQTLLYLNTLNITLLFMVSVLILSLIIFFIIKKKKMA